MACNLGIRGSASVIDLVVVALNSPAFVTLSIRRGGLLLA
jgi:hypothetical protein